MPDLATELTAYLKSIPAVTSKVGVGVSARIYEGLAKQDVTTPYIVMIVYEGTSNAYLGGITGIASNRVELVTYGATKAEAYALHEAVRLAPLQNLRGQMAGLFVNDVTSDQGYDSGFDPAVKGGNNKRYWLSRDYIITYNEAVV